MKLPGCGFRAPTGARLVVLSWRPHERHGSLPCMNNPPIDAAKNMAHIIAIFDMPRPQAFHLRERLELASFFGQLHSHQPVPNRTLKAILDWLATASEDDIAALWRREDRRADVGG